MLTQRSVLAREKKKQVGKSRMRRDNHITAAVTKSGGSKETLTLLEKMSDIIPH